MDKKGIIGVAICVVVLIAWYPLVHALGWAPARPAPRRARPAVATTPAAQPSELTAAVTAPASPVAVDAPAAPAATPAVETVLPAEIAPAAAVAPEATAELTVPGRMTVRIDTRHGGVVGVDLSRYTEDDRKTPMKLGVAEYPLCALRAGADGPRLGPARVAEQTASNLVLERTLGDGPALLREQWRVASDSVYDLQYRVQIVNPGPEPLSVTGLGLACGGLRLTAGSRGASSMMGEVDFAVDLRRTGDPSPSLFDVKKLGKMDDAGRRALAATSIDWLALHSKYFLFHVRSETPMSGCQLAVRPVSGSDQRLLVASVALPSVQVAAGQEWSRSFACYAGPKEYAQLQRLGGGVESVMRLNLFFFWHPAWMGWISSGILRSLLYVHDVLDHRWAYGWAIILITFVIKTLFWPLTHSSTVSMRRMQKIQPLVQEVREKYKDDAQKMNRRVMELYREHKVNPVGGCLPIVLQIPVFFALFNTLRGAIELRHASFLWVADLASPDDVLNVYGLPIRPLAILMIVTMFVQQKMTPTSMDPTQAKMMMFMTLFFGFIFYGMPAGLNLYWTVNQLLTIGQTVVTHRLEQMREARHKGAPAPA